MGVNGEQQRPSQTGRLLAFGQRQVDRVVAPPTRQRAYEAVASFAAERPILSAFLASQLLFSFLPLVLFASFVLSTAAFALVAAVVFVLFWTGVASLVLVPTVCVSFGAAVLVWAWAASTFVVARWVYARLPVIVRGGDGDSNSNKALVVKMPDNRQVVFEKKTEPRWNGPVAGNEDYTKMKKESKKNGVNGGHEHHYKSEQNESRNRGLDFDYVDSKDTNAGGVATEFKD